MIFGTLGHNAAGTKEKLTPRTTIKSTANHCSGNIGNTKAKHKWQTIIMIAPTMSMEAPFPLLSKKIPKSGVKHIARIGKQLNSCAPTSGLTLKVFERKSGAYLWNGKIAE